MKQKSFIGPKIILSLLSSWMFYCILNFTLQAVLVESRPMEFQLLLDRGFESNFSISYNLKEAQAGAQVFKNPTSVHDPLVIQTPYLKDNTIRRIYLNATVEEQISIKEFSIKNSYNHVKVGAHELINYLNLSSYNTQQNEGISLKSNQIEVLYKNGLRSLELNSELIAMVYKRLFDPIRWISKSATLLFFLVFSYVLLKQTKFNFSTELIFVSFFITIVYTPFFTHKHHQSSENRTLEPFPKLTGNIWKIPSKFENYFNDHFPFKSELSQLNNYIKVIYLGVSPSPEKVRIGKDGWLYYSTDKIKTVFRGTELYTDEELEVIQNKLELKAQFLKDKGIDFYLMVPPLKHTVYPEYLPKSLEIKGITKRIQVMNFLKNNSSIKVIDPYTTLMNAKDSIRIYYKNDMHWNQAGAFLVYQQMIREISAQHPEVGSAAQVDSYNITRSIDYEGDLIPLINLRNEFYREPYFFSLKTKSKAGLLQTGAPMADEANFIFYNSQEYLADKPRLLMYRDSYSEYLHGHLSQHFSYSSFAWSRNLTEERINREKPDILVLEIMERFVDHLLTENEK